MRYEEWYESPQGCFALTVQQALLHRMISGWPRRGHNLLELFCGSGRFLQSFWESGFDVTGQEQNQKLAQGARERLGKRVSITLNSPECLPFDDQSFDYVVCLNGLEFAENPAAVLGEAARLSSLGILLGFPNAWSLRGLLSSLASKKNLADSGWQFGRRNNFSPLTIWKMIRRLAAPAKPSWGSALLGPGLSWREGRLSGRLNLWRLPVPVGACAMLRLDLAPSYAGTPLLLRVSGQKENLTKTALAKDGACSRLSLLAL